MMDRLRNLIREGGGMLAPVAALRPLRNPQAQARATRMPVAKGEWWQILARAPQAAEDAKRAELLIYGDIGEDIFGETVTARELVQQLSELDAEQLDVRINSYGGSVSDGLAIFSALRRYNGTVTTYIDGVAYSIASLIAMGGQSVHMSANALFMVHAPWTIALGNSRDMRQTADTLDTYAEAMADAYVRHVGADARDEVLGLLTDGEDHYYTAEQAEAAGFVDVVDDALAAAAHATAHSFREIRGVAGGGERPATAGQPTPPPSATPAPSGADQNEDAIMWKALAKALGVSVADNATENDARAALVQHLNIAADANDDAVIAAATAGRSAAQTVPAPASAPAAAGVTDPHAEFRAAETQRKAGIRAAFKPWRDHDGIADVENACIDDSECTVEKARAKLLDAMAAGAEPMGGASGMVLPGADQRDHMREGAAAALMHRENPSAAKLDDNARNYRGMRALDIGRECCEASGIRTRGLTPSEIAVKALHGTDDFPFILENIATKTLRRGYEGTRRTFTAYCAQATLPDFKDISRVQLGGAPDLKKVVEGAEYEVGEIGEGREKYRVQKYGRLVPFTWEMMVNDDLGAFMRLLTMFGRSAGDLESDLVYGIFTSNPNMADGNPLFDTSFKNLITGPGTVISDDSLGVMRKNMLLQKGLEDRYINVRPEFLLVPPSLQVKAEKQLAIVQPNKADDVSPFSQALQLIVEPRLEDASSTAWFMAASAEQIDTIEYAYLEGNEGVFTESKASFEHDGFIVKARHVFGTKAIDRRGLSKNVGA